MKILNLVDQSKSDIKYKIIPFPDGQKNINIISGFWNGIKNKVYNNIQIKSRLNNFQDLEIIACATKSLRELKVKDIYLYTPYFLGSRSDRKFEEGSCNYLKDIICPFINSLNFESVTILDPHSHILEACLNNFKSVSNIDLIRWTKEQMNISWNEFCDNKILISPDAGANHKIYKLAEQIGYKGNIITCSKERDENGKLTKCVVPVTKEQLKSKKDYIIIDDICDGGNTFINISKEIKSTFDIYSKTEKPKIYLIVTHGIFSKGYKELSQYFDGIYTTNSYSDLRTQDDKEAKIATKLIKQLNIF